jgi:hypothetical protein
MTFIAHAKAWKPYATGTKFKWIGDEETYRVAIKTKNGILEVKRVSDGAGYCHDYMVCKCRPCSDMALSHKLGVAMPPWQTQAPLKKTFFATELDWRTTLPSGSVTITPPRLSDSTLKKLCNTPLTATTDGLKLKELEERFPDAVFVLSTDQFYEIAYEPGVYGDIYCEKHEISAPYFWHFGGSEKPQLMAEWRGMYIDLSHLF